jgi:hypothetical protein
MRKVLSALIVTLVLMSGLPAHAEPASAPSAQEIQDAVRRMKEGIPVIMRMLDVIGREAPALQQIMQRAAAQGGKVDVPQIGPEGPSAEQMTEQLKALQRVLDVMREAAPIFERVQRQLNVDAVNAPVKVGAPVKPAPPARTQEAPRSQADDHF